MPRSPQYAAIHSHVLQDVLARLDTTSQAFFRRTQRGEQAGFPRFKGRERFHSFTYKEYGNGARLDNGDLVLAKIGRLAVRWSRPLDGTPRTITLSREADGWYVAISCAEVPVTPLPRTGEATGMDLGLESFATLADATRAKLVHALLRQEHCTCDLATILGVSESASSQHLRQLRALHLVKSRREGKFVYHSLDDDHIVLLIQLGLSYQGHDAQLDSTSASGACGAAMAVERAT